jgi:hypothetical protein
MSLGEFPPLPLVNVEPGVRKGRNPLEGYQRGFAIASNIAAVEREQLYQRAFHATGLQMLFTPQKRANIYLILTRFLRNLSSRNIVEFGAYKGGSAVFMALVLREIAPEAIVYALDTFEGMPEVNKRIDAHHRGDFSDTTLQVIAQRAYPTWA